VGEPDEVTQLIQRYREILAGRRQRYACDSAFGGRKREFEKALLERLGAERDPQQAAALVEMYAQLAFFVPQPDMELDELCRRRGEQDQEFHSLLELMEAGDHEAIQKQLAAKNVPELIRYYALHRRAALESSARRQQALSVQELNA
jgi:hypothetical protein